MTDTGQHADTATDIGHAVADVATVATVANGGVVATTATGERWPQRPRTAATSGRRGAAATSGHEVAGELLATVATEHRP